MEPVELDDDDEGKKGRSAEHRPFDYVSEARAALHDKDMFSHGQMQQIARVAVEAIREVSSTAGEAKGQLTKSLSTAKLVIPIAAAIVGAAIWLVSLGERISVLSTRSTEGVKIGAEARGRTDVQGRAIDGMKYQIEAGVAERASLRAQVSQNREALATQVEALRKDREQLAVSVARIETQLSDVRSALDRLENAGRRGNLKFIPPWRDAQTPPP